MWPVVRWKTTPPIAPANAPMPTTEPTANLGNMSLARVYTFADHAWCAAAATLTISTAAHMLGARDASVVGTMSSAMASIVALRARFTVQPRLISALEIQPPPTDPTSAMRYTAMMGAAT